MYTVICCSVSLLMAWIDL